MNLPEILQFLPDYQRDSLHITRYTWGRFNDFTFHVPVQARGQGICDFDSPEKFRKISKNCEVLAREKLTDYNL